MSTYDHDPDISDVPKLTELSACQFLSSDHVGYLMGDVQRLIVHVSRRGEAELNGEQRRLAIRTARAGSRAAIELLLDRDRTGEAGFVEDPEALREKYQLVVSGLVQDGDAIFDVMSRGPSSPLQILGRRALSFDAGSAPDYYAQQATSLAAHLDLVAQALGIYDLAKLEIPQIRTSLENYGENILELIAALAEKKGGLLLNSELAVYLGQIGRAAEAAFPQET